MKVTLDWLKDFVDIDIDAKELADKLVKVGFEVEEIIKQSDAMQNVVVGKIVSLEKHPDADKLQICKIDVAKDRPLQIVTGASNIKVGDLVPVAMDNSLLPNGTRIKKGKLRGVESEGMLCSGEELKLTESDYSGASVYGILILKDDAVIGQDLNAHLGTDKTILDIGITADRSDCNSVLGIAREVASVLNKPLKMPKMSYKVQESEKIGDFIGVEVKNKTLCPRYMAAFVKDIKIEKSPEYISSRLKAVGIRSINNIVDATNYVLVEIGQPMHAFDYDFLKANKIVVRNANEGEKITALNDIEYTMTSDMLAICDGEKPAAVAGVMGGANSGISDSTKAVVFESAKFLRDNIRKTSRKLNLRSDSSYRFERGIDFASQEMGITRILALIDEMNAGTIVSGLIDVNDGLRSSKIVSLRASRIAEILGIDITGDRVADILNSLQIKTTFKNGNLTCTIPPYRDDLENANDIAEEVIRVYGYDNIEARPIDVGIQTMGGRNSYQQNIEYVRNYMVSQGASETLTYSFTTPKMFDELNIDSDSKLRNVIKLKNPLGEDASIMRTLLSYSMIKVMASNLLKSNMKARLFEIANVYTPIGGEVLPNESQHLVCGFYGKNEDFYSIKGVLEALFEHFGLSESYKRSNVEFLHKGRAADIMANGVNIGFVGELSADIAEKFDVAEKLYIAEIDLETMLNCANLDFVFKPVPKFPAVERDLAIIVDDSVEAAAILDCVRKSGGKTLNNVKIFDVYKGKHVDAGKKSVAFSMEFRLPDGTLTDDEVNAKINKILKNLAANFEAVLR